jgi:hypothetical protein
MKSFAFDYGLLMPRHRLSAKSGGDASVATGQAGPWPPPAVCIATGASAGANPL